MAITQLPPETPAATAHEVLECDGAVILLDAAPLATVTAAERELSPWLSRPGSSSPLGNNEFGGWSTLRTSGLIAKSRACGELAMNGAVLAIADRVLGPQCSRFQLSFTQAIKIDPGERAQVLHRDSVMYPFRLPGPEVFLNAIWAVTSFSNENGGTRFHLGSHRWADDSEHDHSAATVCAEMARGSVLIYYGSCWHGGGANSSAAARIGIAMGYTLGWLRQEENQYLAVPPDIAATLPTELRRLIGYAEHYPFLGWYEGEDEASFRGGSFRKNYSTRVVGADSTSVSQVLAQRKAQKPT